MKLRGYQQEIVDYIDASAMFGSNRVCAEAPTGSGKSLMIAEMCRKYNGEHIMILVNVSKLIGQISDHLDELDIDHSILKSGWEHRFDEDKKVQVIMEQTYHSRKAKLDLKADVLIRDEHHIGFNGDRFSGILRDTSPRLVVGFSATPYDNYGVSLSGYETFSKVGIKRLTKEGHLMPANTYVTRFGQAISFKGIGKSGDYSESELDGLLNTPEYNKNVVEAYKQIAGNRRAIVFVSGIAHADELVREFKRGHVAAAAYHSKKADRENALKLADFKAGRCEVLVSVSSLTTGFDMPDCSVMMNCRPTKVHSLKVQMEGRVLRPNGDPIAMAKIIDCCRATTDHGLYDEEFTPFKDLKTAKANMKHIREPIIDYIMKEDPNEYVTVNRGYLDNMLRKVKLADTVNALAWRFEQTETASEMVIMGLSLHRKIWKSKHNNSLDFIMKTVGPAVARDGLGVYKSRMRNIIRKGGKPAALHYFPAWYLENRGW